MFMIKEIWLNLRIPMYIQEADFWDPGDKGRAKAEICPH